MIPVFLWVKSFVFKNLIKNNDEKSIVFYDVYACFLLGQVESIICRSKARSSYKHSL